MKKFINYISTIIWLSAIFCISIIIYNQYKNNDTINSDSFFSNGNQGIDSLFLNAGEISFKDKTSFVVNIFRYHGSDETLPEEIDVKNNPQKLYNYIFEKKSKKLPTVPSTTMSDDGFSIKPIR